MKKKLGIFLILSFISSLFLIGQVPQQEQNLQKYWRMRERLKNFVVPGDGQGGSLLSTGRESYYSHKETQFGPITDKITSGFLNYGDEVIRFAHYVSALAMEYKVMRDKGLSNALLDKTAQELAYALQAFNRLDITAESSWNTHYTGPPCSYPLNPDKEFLRSHNLNGFFIREDVPSNFPNLLVNGNLVENHLNSSYFPADDGRIVDDGKIKCFYTGDINSPGSGFEACEDFNGRFRGPGEESLDQAIHMMMALATVVRCIPANTSALDYQGNVFNYLDVPVGIAEEAQRISSRITHYMQVFNWKIENPVTCSCVKGVNWDVDLEGVDPCKCASGGAFNEPFSYAMAYADSRIQTAIPGVALGNDLSTDMYYCSNYRCSGGCPGPSCPSDAVLASSESLWNYFETNTIDDDGLLSILAAISNVWQADTEFSLYYRCDIASPKAQRGSKWHLPLLNKFLYGGALADPFFNDEFYADIMTTAQCYSCHISDGPDYAIWSNGDGLLLHGINTDNSSSEINNIAYLYYFNLFNLYKTSYLSSAGVAYRYIEPSQLCEVDINKSGFMYNINQDFQEVKIQFIESDQKGFHAANSINVSGGSEGSIPVAYVIENDNDDQPWPLSQANIIYEAGQEINLHPGFEVHEGAEFHATINPSLEAMACTGTRSMNPNFVNNAPQSTLSHLSNEELNSIFRDRLSKENQVQEFGKKIDSKPLISILPNPNTGSFQINVTKIENAIGIKEVRVYDILGKTVWQSGPSSNTIFEVDILNAAPGIYYVKCVSELGEIMTEKLIKQ